MECDHPPGAVTPGPRVPLRWGSAATEVCAKCGGHRVLHGRPDWRPGPPDTSDDDDDC